MIRFKRLNAQRPFKAAAKMDVLGKEKKRKLCFGMKTHVLILKSH